MASPPALSILMPVFNEAAMIERAIAVTLACVLPAAFELIIVDDGSTDGTRAILDRAALAGGEHSRATSATP